MRYPRSTCQIPPETGMKTQGTTSHRTKTFGRQRPAARAGRGQDIAAALGTCPGSVRRRIPAFRVLRCRRNELEYLRLPDTDTATSEEAEQADRDSAAT